MSIFLEQHHNTLLLEYLSIDDIARLSQVSKYYYKLTQNILASLREFNKVKNTLHMKEIPTDSKKYIITKEELASYDIASRILIQAHIHGNIDIIKYVTNKNKHTMLKTITVTLQSGYGQKIEQKMEYVATILVSIAIYKKRLDILSFLVNYYDRKKNGICLLLLQYNYVTNNSSQYINDRIMDILRFP